MIKQFLLLSFICLTTVYSQGVNYHSKDKDFLIGQSYLIYQNDSYLYKKPTYDSKALKILTAGEEIEVIDISTVASGRGSNTGVYLKVKTKDNKEGFVSSTDLSLGYFVTTNGVYIMYQKQRHVDETLLHFNKLDEDGVVTDLGPFSYEKLDFSISLQGNRGLPRIDHILTLNFQSFYCEGPPTTQYLSLNLERNELLYVTLLKNYCPDEKYATLQKLVFPDEEDGVANAVVYFSSKKKLISKKNQEYKTYIYTRAYKWASGTLMGPIEEFYWSVF